MELSVDVVRIGITIINFVILLAILKRFLFKPVMNIINSRQEEIDFSIRTTSENEASAKSNRLETEKQLKESRVLGKSIVEEYKVKAQQLSDDIVKQAKNEAQTIMDRAVRETQREKEKAEEELKQHAVELALMLSSKALEETIDEEQHRRLINDFIAKVGT